jgi:cytochrome P450
MLPRTKVFGRSLGLSETLLRKCIKDTVVAGVTIKAGPLVFNCHGAAMQDAQKIPQPNLIDAFRKPEPKPYSRGADARREEVEQSFIYLQHGYGRHKCLGRYASEITMQEVLRAVLRKDGDITRANGKDLEMDENNLYAKSFTFKFA